MKYVMFLLTILFLATSVYAGPDDKWMYVGPSQTQEIQFDGIALLLAVGAFAWVYVIYKDTVMKAIKRR